MGEKRKPKKKASTQKIQVTEKDGTVKIIGRYNQEKKEFSCVRNKSEHFMRKNSSWALDANVIKFLAQEGATILLKDKESKWEYKSEATNFIMYGIIEEYNQHRPQYFLGIEHWEVITAKHRSMVIRCHEKDCRFNFTGNCLKGAIEINSDGLCAGYEDKID
jgi:hypothetical protein